MEEFARAGASGRARIAAALGSPLPRRYVISVSGSGLASRIGSDTSATATESGPGRPVGGSKLTATM